MAGRTILVTGSARGIGGACMARIRAEGDRAIGLDLEDAEVIADLASADGRAAALEAVREQAGGVLHGVIACAGIAGTDGPAMVSVNYFGTVALIEGLRPLLDRAERARVVVVSSFAIILGHDGELVEACLSGDEALAIRIAGDETRATNREKGDTNPAYASTKVALSRWVRRTAIRPEWAGRDILLNAVAPGTVLTRITRPILATEQGRAMLAAATPIAVPAHAEAEDVAPLLTFLASADCRYIVGQTIFTDGGADVIRRGDALPGVD